MRRGYPVLGGEFGVGRPLLLERLDVVALEESEMQLSIGGFVAFLEPRERRDEDTARPLAMKDDVGVGLRGVVNR